MTSQDRRPSPREEPAREDRRRRLQEVFGDVLPEATSDDATDQHDQSSDEWLRRQVPPHHG